MNPKAVGKYVRVQPGDSVKVGDVIAVKKTFVREVKVLSEIEGTVMGYERDSGELLIRPLGMNMSDKGENVVSPIDGIVSVCNNDQIVIQTDKDVIVGERGVGGRAESELVEITSNERSDTALLFSLSVNDIGKVILVQRIDRDTLLKAIGMGVEGIISAEVVDSDMGYLLQRNISTPVLLVSQDSWKKVARWVGKKIYIDGMGKTVLLLHT
jgi:hypothetical protein